MKSKFYDKAREETFFKERCEYYNLPNHMHGAIVRYIMDGIPPGHFLTAVIDNDLREAFSRADDKNKPMIEAFLQYFYMEAPAQCHGSERDMERWIERGGLNGNPKEQAS